MPAPRTIYLDHNATTPTRPEVTEAIAECLRQGYANPASQHQLGQQAKKRLEEARQQVGRILGAEVDSANPDRVVFTSGGTEANNLAVLGIARARTGGRPGQLVISAVEHASVIEPAEYLLEQGWRLDTLGVDRHGVIRLDDLEKILTPETAVVSVISGNHETGVLQPVCEAAAVCQQLGVPLHTDAIQVAGKLPVHFRQLGVAALSAAAHKFQGPLGIGVLIVRHDVPIDPLEFGGPHQWRIRPGTESVALAVGMATALELWRQEQEEHARRLTALRERFEAGLKAGFPGLVVNGEGAERLPQTANLAFPGIEGQVLLMALDMAGVACSVGSACSSGSTELSPTLRAMKVPQEFLTSSLRFSLGATTTEEEIDEAVRRILHVVRELRG